MKKGHLLDSTTKYLTEDEIELNKQHSLKENRHSTAIALTYADKERLKRVAKSLGLKSPAEAIRYLTSMFIPVIEACYENQTADIIKQMQNTLANK